MITGLDLGSIRSGWCFGEGLAVPEVGVWDFPEFGDDYGLLLDTLHGHVVAHIERFQPTLIGYESPILRPIDTLHKLRRLYPLGPFVEWVCRTKGVECIEHNLHDMKLTLAGDRNAKKPQMVAAARRLGIALPPGKGAEDAADAFAAWLETMRQADPVSSRQWDTRSFSNRGALF